MNLTSVAKTMPQHSGALNAAAANRPVQTAGIDEKTADTANAAKLREAFNDFVGQTFYGQMLSAMRSTLDKPAYFHGGPAEDAFQAQLDQVLAEKMADASAQQFTEPLFQLFNLSRK